MRLSWPKVAKKKDSYNNWLDMKTLDEIILYDKNSDHKVFMELLEFMFKLDPKTRPTA